MVTKSRVKQIIFLINEIFLFHIRAGQNIDLLHSIFKGKQYRLSWCKAVPVFVSLLRRREGGGLCLSHSTLPRSHFPSVLTSCNMDGAKVPVDTIY